MPDGYRPAMPQVRDMDELFGTHKVRPHSDTPTARAAVSIPVHSCESATCCDVPKCPADQSSQKCCCQRLGCGLGRVTRHSTTSRTGTGAVSGRSKHLITERSCGDTGCNRDMITSMRARSIRSLTSLSEPNFLHEMAIGLELVSEHVAELELARKTLLSSSRWRGSEVVRVVADEEAAKFLILLDAVRCDRRAQSRKSEQLARFNNHLAKGVYAKICEMRPASYGELLKYVNQLRRRYYLDGPNDVDWIFHNEIEAGREERLYTDYVESDEGTRWHSPKLYDEVVSELGLIASKFDDSIGTSTVVELVAAMVHAGFVNATSLEIVSSIWRSFEPQLNTPWAEVAKRIHLTLIKLYEAGLMGDGISASDERMIMDSWTYPIHAADLTFVEINPLELRDQQNNWHPPDF
jgi:hypothetical protein